MNKKPYTVQPESVQPIHTLVRARKRSSFSYPKQTSTLVPYRTSEIEIENNELRPSDTGHPEPTNRTTRPTFQNFNFQSP